MKTKSLNRGILCIGLVVSILSLSSCSGQQSESPNTYGARAGEEGAKYFKDQNPGVLASEESAGEYCAAMAEEGGLANNWTAEDVIQAADSCSIWFTTEMFRN